MLILDTHIWIWWVQGDSQLSAEQQEWIKENQEDGIGVSAITCLEVARLVESERLILPLDVENWMHISLSYPGIKLIPLTPHIAIASTKLPGDFHKDPADRILVATARALKCPLITADTKILDYPHVQTTRSG